MVGNTPVLRITAPFADDGHGFWAKLEGFNPGGMKDRPAMHMVERGRVRGDLQPGDRIVESTSGTLGLGLALAGTVYGHPVTLVTDPGLEPIIDRMLRAYGADVDMVTTAHRSGGWQQARRDRVAEILRSDARAWYPDQYNNPDNVDAYRGLALELLAQLGTIDVLVCSVGTGGHSAGVARVLRESNPGLRLIGVDTVGSTIFGQPAGSRVMRGLGRASTHAMWTTRHSTRCTGWRRRRRCGRAAHWRPPTTPAAAGASARWRWWQGGRHARIRPIPPLPRSSRTDHNATSTPCTTTSSAGRMTYSPAVRHRTPPRSMTPQAMW